MLRWMAEAHEFQTLQEYAHHMKTQPGDAWPLRRLGDQMRASVKQALMGRAELVINQALRRADLDVLFLFHLHQQSNCRLAEKERYFASHSLMLAQELSALVRERINNARARHNRMMVGLNLPYPLNPETAAAVDAAIQNHVIPWETLEESDDVAGWVTDSFVAEGKTELPEGAYRLRRHYIGSLSGPDPEEVRARFEDQGSYDKFLAEEDYSYGLADVTNAEFSAHYETLVSAMKDLDGLMVEPQRIRRGCLGLAAVVVTLS